MLVIRAMTPERLTQYSDRVFAGDVTSVTTEKAQGRILTRVVFKNLKFAKGEQAADSIRLTLEGGRVGEELVVVDGQPEFEIGLRYIVFATTVGGYLGQGPFALRVVGMQQGCFRVIQAPTVTVTQVLDYDRRPVVQVSADKLTLVLPDSLIPPRLRALRAERDSISHMAAPPESLRRQPYKVLGEGRDPGTRVTEGAFLSAIARLVR
jgi:hypothetical protein